MLQTNLDAVLQDNRSNTHPQKAHVYGSSPVTGTSLADYGIDRDTGSTIPSRNATMIPILSPVQESVKGHIVKGTSFDARKVDTSAGEFELNVLRQTAFPCPIQGFHGTQSFCSLLDVLKFSAT